MTRNYYIRKLWNRGTLSLNAVMQRPSGFSDSTLDEYAARNRLGNHSVGSLVASMTSQAPSSSRAGFFQTIPVLPTQWYEDEVLYRVSKLFIPPALLSGVRQDLDQLSSIVVSTQVIDWITDAEAHPPYLKGFGYDSFGRANDPLVTSEGWKRLQDLGIEQGIVATAYELPETALNRLVQFIKYHVWTPSSAIVTCPSAMQDGAAAVIKSQILQNSSIYSQQAKCFMQDAYLRLTSRDPKIAWTSGQWMTERQGGSDVSNTETLASYIGTVNDSLYTKSFDGKQIPLGPWRIDGFKWFSSATDCGMVLLLAQTSKGLSCFAAPARYYKLENGLETVHLNGMRIQRLKNKLGTRALPTAELELENMRGYLIGEEGKGVKVISGMLNITRVHNAVAATGGFGRGLAIVRAYAKVRKVAGGFLKDVALFRRTIAAQALEYRASTLLTFLTVSLLGLSEHSSSPLRNTSLPAVPTGHIGLLLRVLTPLTKAHTAKSAIAGLQECMESLGGVGYLENVENQEFNIARIYRDTNVLSIWEGTTDVLATDLVKVIKGKDGQKVIEALGSWIGSVRNTVLSKIVTGENHGPLPNLRPYDQWLEGASVQADLMKSTISPQTKEVLTFAAEQVVFAWITSRNWMLSKSLEEVLADGREVQRVLGSIFCANMLILDALRDDDVVAVEACKRYIAKNFGVSSVPEQQSSWRERSELDAWIAFGRESGQSVAVNAKL